MNIAIAVWILIELFRGTPNVGLIAVISFVVLNTAALLAMKLLPESDKSRLPSGIAKFLWPLAIICWLIVLAELACPRGS
ncbi:MAG TPA: hypothetical protein VGQ71_13505 [Terriglobales bacterium]|jgi:ABC-type amino acid transport system permease subunit|nr:hypothetical protein [Terriglobales bacterium]